MSLQDESLFPLTRTEDIVRTIEHGLFDGKQITGVVIEYELDRRFRRVKFVFDDGIFEASVQVQK